MCVSWWVGGCGGELEEVGFDGVLVLCPDGWGCTCWMGGGGEGGHLEDGPECGCDCLGYMRDGGVGLGLCWKVSWGLLGLWLL